MREVHANVFFENSFDGRYAPSKQFSFKKKSEIVLTKIVKIGMSHKLLTLSHNLTSEF